MKLRTNCISNKIGKHVSQNQALSQSITTQIPPAPSQIFRGQSMSHDYSIKDVIVIAFMLGLWLYSIILMFRAWSKMLNFSDDGGPRPEKATILWKWLMEHIANSRKNGKSGSGSECSSDAEKAENVSQSSLTNERKDEEAKEIVVAVHNNEIDQSNSNNTPYVEIIHKDLLSGGVPTTEDSAPVALTCQQSSSQAATELTTDCSELATQNNQYHQPSTTTTTKSSASLKLSPKLQLTQQPHLVMVKSAGQQHEFKALSLSSDLTQVQEKLATLDHFGSLDSQERPDIEDLQSVKSESINSESIRSIPPELPPKDYFEEIV